MLEEFNFFANKAINQYINKRYNIYDINQQTTDDLRVLKSNATLIPTRVTDYDGALSLADHMATYYVDLPSDYLHLLNCICIYNVKKTYNCYNAGDTWRAAATRLTADTYSQVLDNYWLKPTYKRPYYYIHNINTYNDGLIPTNPYDSNTEPGKHGTDSKSFDSSHTVNSTTILYGTDAHDNTIVSGSGLPTSIDIRGGSHISNVERGQSIRYGNVTKVRLEIRYGTDTSVFSLDYEDGKKGGKIYIDYIKAP